MKKTKYIFITGGVVSGIGKGIIASSIGAILKSSGLNVFLQKQDPYLNIDPGTMNPIEHGEVFVTEDGAETDLDLGNYERFGNVNLTKYSSFSAGKIYKEVLEKERRGDYLGKTVQIIPHVTDLIKSKINQFNGVDKYDIVICEIGGTVGDIESLPFLESIRQIKNDLNREDTFFIHVALLPFLNATGEHKTKPVQHSIKSLLSIGIQPDMLVIRSEKEISESIKQKLSSSCNLRSNEIILCKNEKTIYNVPKVLIGQSVHKLIGEKLKINTKKLNTKTWDLIVKNINASEDVVPITIVGKYIALQDAYLSILESLKISGYWQRKKIEINWIDARNLNEENYKDLLKDSKGILVPGGFGSDGTEGKIWAAKFARENKIPYLGICYGMQMAAIEFARNVLNLKDANTTEVDSKTKNPVIYIIEDHNSKNLGGTLRLGGYTTKISKNTLAFELYKKDTIIERHRHRYEFNSKYKEMFIENGMLISGINDGNELVEIIELKDHPFFIGSQYHPEFTSKINEPNPLFMGFVEAISKSLN
ncbi:CTP synthase [Spiroplasma endosymbiont of Crioceris asparagi]|uniref:CTP synthase n=1 Tax=Spiroplasma endosymbiont of Crioceris asparagi TaxID=3066286 RepID=UPI0030D2AEB3